MTEPRGMERFGREGKQACMALTLSGQQAESQAHQSNGGVLKNKGWFAWAKGVVREQFFDQWAANLLGGDGVYFSAHWAMKNPDKATHEGFYTQ